MRIVEHSKVSDRTARGNRTHDLRRLACGISEELKWVQLTKVGPKIWTDFGPNYYAAYLTEPDGWQLEAVLKTTSLERD